MKKVTLYGSLLSLTAVLVACPQPVTPAPSPTAISGTVQSWNKGAGSVELLAYPAKDKGASNPALATGDIKADGTFSVPVPSAAAVTPYLSPLVTSVSTDSSCTGSFSSSTPGTQSFGVDELDIRQSGAYTTSIVSVNAADQSTSTTATIVITGKLWIYVDKTTTLSGQTNCASSADGLTLSGQLSANAQLNQGWNILAETFTLSGVKASGFATLTGNITATNDASFPWLDVKVSATSLHTASVGKSNFIRSATAAFARLANR